MTDNAAVKIPSSQYAIQLTGPDTLELNTSKAVEAPGPMQVLAKIEAVGLCFSDLKLLKQFDGHVRKGPIVAGLTEAELAEMPFYKPDSQPTVPGHEAICTIVAVGDQVKRHKVGDRCLIQTDYRDFKTARSNAAFGYNLEGGLQEYVIMDERIIIDRTTNESFLIPADAALSSSAVALVEPWACVECSYVTSERQTIRAGGRLVVLCDAGCEEAGLVAAYSSEGAPAEILRPGTDNPDAIDDNSCDDIVYFGSDPDVVEAFCGKLGDSGIFNMVMCGGKFARKVNIDIGRIHYGMTRWIGCTGSDASESYRVIPADGEIRAGDSVLVVGAGGPMGQMHAIRDLCTGLADVRVVATDFDDQRLESLGEKARPLAEANGCKLELVNPKNMPVKGPFGYIAIMAPVPALVAQAVADSGDNCLINIFAGIPAGTRFDMDLDTYVANRCFMFGTSGSRISDMKIVLSKVTAATLDTNCSVDAICGMAGAIDGIRAVENRTLAGKIIAYPQLHDLPLTPLSDLAASHPQVAAKLENGMWTKAAEDQLLGR